MDDNLKKLIKDYMTTNNINTTNLDDIIDEYESEQTFTELKDGSFKMITGNTPEAITKWLNDKYKKE